MWDIAGAHAINLAHGFCLEYLSGGNLDYSAMIEAEYKVSDNVVAGPKQRIGELREELAQRG